MSKLHYILLVPGVFLLFYGLLFTLSTLFGGVAYVPEDRLSPFGYLFLGIWILILGITDLKTFLEIRKQTKHTKKWVVLNSIFSVIAIVMFSLLSSLPFIAAPLVGLVISALELRIK